MWLMTKHGFYSVTERPGVPGEMQIRARVKEHLENLPFAVMPEIISSRLSDYRYRVYVTREQWGQVAVCLAGDIDYTNFKSKVHDMRTSDLKTTVPVYYRFLTQVWTLGERMLK